MIKLWKVLGSSQNWTILRVISIHFRFFSYGQGTELKYILRVAKFQIFGCCMGPSLRVKKNGEFSPPPGLQSALRECARTCIA